MKSSDFFKNLDSIHKLTSTLYIYYYKSDYIAVLLDENIDIAHYLVVRGEIIKNHLGIWELYHNKNLLDYPLNEREMNLVKKEIKKFNEYECRHCEDIFKSKGLKDVGITQLSMF